MFNQKFFNTKNLAIKIGGTSALYPIIYSNLYPSSHKDLIPASKELSDEVNLQAKKMGIKHPVAVYASNNRNGAFSGVNAAGKWNSMKIILDPDLRDKRFVMSHELAHAKNNDFLNTQLILLAAAHLQFLNVPVLAPLFFMLFVKLSYGRYSEKRADLTAAKHCKNIEVAAAIREHSNIKAKMLKYRISSGFWTDIIDPHPSPSSRIDYLQKFIEQRKDDDSIIQVAFQTIENGPFTQLPLTREQSSLLRQIIQNSPKKETNGALERIVLRAGNAKGNVQLFHHGDDFPVHFDFDSDVIKDHQLLPAIIETIMHSPERINMKYEFPFIPLTGIGISMLTEFFERDLRLAPEEQLNIIKVNDCLDLSEQYLIVYTGRELSLTSDKRFDLDVPRPSELRPG